MKLTSSDKKILESVLHELNSRNKPRSQAGYKILIDRKCTHPERSQKKCRRDFKLDNAETLDWESIHLLPRLCTVSPKLRNFQFKFFHRTIAANSFLYKITFSETNPCCFCQTAQETLLHLFWECPTTRGFWRSVELYFV